jgi:predicted ATPase
MKRYILTGTPGCGKTSILRALEMQGYAVIEEAATDVITYKQAQGIEAPWTNPVFIDNIIALQKHRQLQTAEPGLGLQFYDRSPICTYALSEYTGLGHSNRLLEEISRITEEKTYQNKVFFIENLGFCQQTPARRISYEQSLAFEKTHLEMYTRFGYECEMIPIDSIINRAQLIVETIYQS